MCSARGGFLLGFEELGLGGRDVSCRVDADRSGIELRERCAVLDDGVAAGLGDGGVIYLAVTVPAVTDEVDDDIGVEALAVLGGDAGDADDGIGIFGVDVEDGYRKALGDVGRKARGVGLGGDGGEAEEVVAIRNVKEDET